jgi:transposase
MMQNNDQSQRKGIFTTGIVLTLNDQKIALFYKTENGARVGDLFMRLIHTSNLAGVNPFDHLTALQQHASELSECPGRWIPWNYTAASSQIEPS